MCMMCEQEALYDAYLEFVARKEAEAAAKGELVKGSAFKAEAIEDADEPIAMPARTPKEN